MSCFSRWGSGSAALLALGMTASAVAPLVTSAPASAQANFSDVGFNYWGRPFIQVLAENNIIAGFPDGTFKPDKPVTRAEFAAILRQAFSANEVRSSRAFSDVPAGYWAAGAINNAYQTAFMSGYEGDIFRPMQEIPKVQVLVALASGLNLTSSGSPSTTLNIYRDAGDVPSYAVDKVAGATTNGVVVNYPDVQFLNPNDTATRADVAAYIYQALVKQGKLPAISSSNAVSRYIVGGTAGSGTSTQTTSTTGTQKTGLKILQGTKIKVKYPVAGVNQIVLAPGQTISTTLEVAEDVKNLNGEVVIPVASQIQGRLVPINVVGSTTPGTQFVVDKLTIRNQAYTTLNVTSDPIIATNQVSAETVEDAQATPAAQAILGRILGGGANLSSILAGVLTGQTATPPASTNQNSVIVVEPSTDLLLTFRSDLDG